MSKIKLFLLIELILLLIIWIWVIIATAVTDWSKSSIGEYGIWRACSTVTTSKVCENWNRTEMPVQKDCEGALIATRAFSVLSIIFVGFCIFLVVAMLAKASLINKKMLLINICLLMVTFLWLMVGWIMWLGVSARDMCVYGDNTTHLGSSWFLQFFAWLLSFLAIALAALAFLKWKKTPRVIAPPQYAPGPVPSAGGPVPYYPQYPYDFNAPTPTTPYMNPPTNAFSYPGAAPPSMYSMPGAGMGSSPYGNPYANPYSVAPHF